MKRALFLVPVLAGLLLGGSLVAQNKPTPTKLGYIEAEKVVAAHPDFKKVKDIQDQAKKELDPLVEKIKPLDAKLKAGNATAKEQQDYQILRQSYADAQKKWADKQQTALTPITDEIDKIIAKFAEQQGFAMIFDFKVARDSGLVVYGANDLNVTDAVIKLLPKN